jgi:hypothetical protein
MPSPRFLGGDFNVSPTQANGVLYKAISAAGWTDAWRAYTGSASGGETKRSRIDYWFWQSDGPEAAYHPGAMTVGRLDASDHRPLYASFERGAARPAEGWTLHDDFNDGQIDSRWTVRVFSGSQTTDVAVNAESGALTIHLAPSPGSSKYNGVRSIAAYSFANAEASVDLACAPSADADGAFAMFTLGTDAQHFYRAYVSGGELRAEKNAGAGKIALGDPVPFDGEMRRIRIRHDERTGHVVFERGDAHGRWEPYYEEPWSPEIPLEVLFELKAGTSAGQAPPGRVCWDNFDARGR